MQTSFLRRYRFTIQMLVVYLLFIGIIIAKPLDGDISNLLLFFWPYPLVLALRLGEGLGTAISLVILGLLLVTLFGAFLQRRFPVFSKSRVWVHIASLFLWYVPLLTIQVLCILIVLLLGYSVAE